MRTAAGVKPRAEFRYYEVPPGSPALALLGEQVYKGAPDQLHFHNLMEIGYCCQGEGVMVFGDSELAFDVGTFTIIPRNFLHVTNSTDGWKSVWKYLIIDTGALLANFYRDDLSMRERLTGKVNRKIRVFKEEEQPECALLILRIMDVMQGQRQLYREEAKGLIWNLLIHMAQWNEESGEEEDDQSAYAENSVIISRALDYVSKVPERPIRIEELARLCHISETHFRRVFVECMKTTPVEYINRARIKKACNELAETNDSISAIAARTGFGTLSTFNRNFRQIMGVSPQQWRKNARE